MTIDLSLTPWQKGALLAFSFLVVAFGQPAWSEWLSILSAFCGFACFWRVLLSIPEAKTRFYFAFGWYGAVQAVQLSWFLSHPYLYIYGVLLFCAVVTGVRWGVLALLFKRESFERISSLLALAGLWTLLEWSRLFILSGLPFNPVGLTLSASLPSLQFASIGGVYGLSFWVILTNLLLLHAWIAAVPAKKPKGAGCEVPSGSFCSSSVATATHSSQTEPADTPRSALFRFLTGTAAWIAPASSLKWGVAFFAFAVPFIFGWAQLDIHQKLMHPEKASVLLVQSALPIEENLKFQSAEEARQFVLDEWHQVLSAIQHQAGQKTDLIVFPEYLVPYGTFHPVFPLEDIQSLFLEIFGESSQQFLPYEGPYMGQFHTDQGIRTLVSNAYVAQSLADLFQAHVVIGLEDSLYGEGGRKKMESYSSAFHFIPGSQAKPARYEKRVLVPMGDIIPFNWCRQLAASYGITGSFTCGEHAKVFQGPVPLGISICYEEIYGNMMRESRVQGAELLVNLTNDGWFPHSRLPKQHFDHARLRTVENGIPSVRACNTGVTGAIDSLGRIVGIFGEDPMLVQGKAGSIRLDVPLYHYSTLYSQFGNFPILGLSAFFVLFRYRHTVTGCARGFRSRINRRK